MLRVLVLSSLLLLANCSAGQILGTLTGGGPNVAANTQLGKENVQGVVIKTEAPRAVIRPKARVDTLDQSQTVTNTNQPWLIILFALALFLDSPVRWYGQIKRAFKKETKND